MEIIHIQLLNKNWTIQFVPKESPQLKAIVTAQQWWGICESDILNIYVADDIVPSLKREALIHELTHAYLGMAMHPENKFDEEFICNFMGNFAESIVKDADLILKMKEGIK